MGKILEVLIASIGRLNKFVSAQLPGQYAQGLSAPVGIQGDALAGPIAEQMKAFLQRDVGLHGNYEPDKQYRRKLPDFLKGMEALLRCLRSAWELDSPRNPTRDELQKAIAALEAADQEIVRLEKQSWLVLKPMREMVKAAKAEITARAR